MSIVPANLWPELQIGTSNTVLFASVSTGVNIVKSAVFTNIDTATHYVTVYVVPGGGVASANNIIIDAFPIAPRQAYVSPELSNLVLLNSMSLIAICDTSNVINTIGSGFIQ
jgi:hypothetical protein